MILPVKLITETAVALILAVFCHVSFAQDWEVEYERGGGWSAVIFTTSFNGDYRVAGRKAGFSLDCQGPLGFSESTTLGDLANVVMSSPAKEWEWPHYPEPELHCGDCGALKKILLRPIPRNKGQQAVYSRQYRSGDELEEEWSQFGPALASIASNYSNDCLARE